MGSSEPPFPDLAERHSVTAPADLPAEHPARFYLPELDTLRFFAFLGVFIAHIFGVLSGGASWPPGTERSLASMGIYGVDLFFALSAFLLTRLFFKEREATGGIDVRSFYVRRILRIWPLYFFFIAFVLCLGRFFFTALALPPLYLLMLLLFLGNFSLPNLPVPPFAVALLWTISVEEQFYLVWPQIIRRTSLRGTRVAALTMFAGSTLAPGIARMCGFGLMMHWTNTLFRLHSFAVGILIATIPHRRIAAMRPISRATLIGAGATLWFLSSRYSAIPLTHSALQVALGYPAVALGAGAFLLAFLGTGSQYPQLAASRLLVYLGKISYGLYVYHALALGAILSLMPILFHGLFMRWPRVILALALPICTLSSAALTLCMAMASYRWLETPFLRLKDRFTLVPSRPV